MSEIDAMQGRIMAALDRIGHGLDALSADNGPDRSDEVEELRAQLEDEKLANAQLEERVKQLRARVEMAEAQAASAENAARSEHHSDTLRSLDADLQALRLANQQLRDNNAALREANATGVVEPHLINKAMMAELNGLRASRDAERAEVDAVLGEIDRLVAAGGDGGAHGGSDAGDAPQKEES